MNRLVLFKENDGLLRFMFAEAQYHVEVREALFKGILGQGMRIIKPWYERAVEKGDFRALPFISTMRSFMGMTMLYGLFSNFFPELAPEKTMEEASDRILDLFLYGIAQPSRHDMP